MSYLLRMIARGRKAPFIAYLVADSLYASVAGCCDNSGCSRLQLPQCSLGCSFYFVIAGAACSVAD